MQRPVPQAAASPTDPTQRAKLLLVEDEPGTRFALREFLSGTGLQVLEADSCASALASARGTVPDLVLMDFVLPDGDALEMLPRLRELAPGAGVVLLTGHGSIHLAVRAMKSGADHFLSKPVQLPELESVLHGLLKQRKLERGRRAERARRDRHPLNPFAGTSAAIRELAREAARVSGSSAPVLISGPTGAGKGVLAAWLHEHGPRADEPFVDINCASLSREFLESELFGHERGAFTGAVAAKPGLLEVADRGTLFLDEIGDMSIEIQPRLLKVLEQGRYRRVGSVQDRSADVRLIAASHHDLASRARTGAFREDLYFRIQTLPLRMPSLRDRIEDLPVLAQSILRDLAMTACVVEAPLEPEVLDRLARYEWPGNVRELRNVLERALLLSRDGRIRPEDVAFRGSLEPRTPARALGVDIPDGELPLSEVEKRYILQVLQAHQGSVREAAQILQIPRSSLYQKLQRFGIPAPRRTARAEAVSENVP